MENKDQDLLLNYEEKSRTELLHAFYLRGYNQATAIEKLVMARIPHEKWKGSIKGVLLICLAVCYILISIPTNSFGFEIDSSGDLLRLNEWVLKPFLILNFFLLGGLLLKNRENFPFKLKILYLIIIAVVGLIEAVNNHLFNFIVAGAAFYAIISVKEKSKKILSSSNASVDDVQGSPDEKAFKLIEKGFLVQDIEDILLANYWRGRLIFPLFIAVFVLFFSSPISSPGEFDMNNYDKFIWISRILTGLAVLALTTGVLLGINEKLIPKIARFVLTGVFFVAAVWIFFTYGFQIMGMLMIVVAVASLMLALQPVHQREN